MYTAPISYIAIAAAVRQCSILLRVLVRGGGGQLVAGAGGECSVTGEHSPAETLALEVGREGGERREGRREGGREGGREGERGDERYGGV